MRWRVKKSLFGVSGFHYVSLVLKWVMFAFYWQKRQRPVLIGNAWAEQKIRSSSSTRSVYCVKGFWGSKFEPLCFWLLGYFSVYFRFPGQFQSLVTVETPTILKFNSSAIRFSPVLWNRKKIKIPLPNQLPSEKNSKIPLPYLFHR